jgi:hypothetical protein
LELAARADVLGVGGDAVIDGDPAQLLLLAARVRRAQEVQQDLHDDLAIRIAMRVGELLFGAGDET